ncbi:MAG TPA: EI24 domain-containing protein [Chitinophagaceae bacterium]|nr:EI24 domain-containing protein [Chitinophagaceae bacterium]HNF29910.1 EI24 domain-containing protein [Chitinophagaceae bacterium]HNJ58222.1 EI24 domain-containing protein [Chitinophagaceae bacterium]HNL82112.1 EI24 domain-containing protein [Chitinophagaceae bacterium]HNM34593.1 EI24 domain-containing protein [Chitinophagaceae bacterium]
MLKDFIIALQAYRKAHLFIQKYKLWKWIILPGLFYCILFLVGMYFFGNTANSFIEWLKGFLINSLNKVNSSFLNFVVTLSGIMIWVILMLLYFSFFKYFFLIVGSPIFAYLSEKTASIIEGKDYPFNFSQILKDIVRGIRISLRNALWQTVYLFSILIIGMIPLVGWFVPVLALLIECYYYGFSMLDYSMERNKKSVFESVNYIGVHKGLAIGNGFVFYTMHLLPVIGWVLAPAYAVIAATLSIYDLKEKS